MVIFLGETFLDKPEDLSVRESEAWVVVPVVPDVTDLLVSPASVVTEFCDGSSCCPDWELVEPQSLSFSKKRAHCTVWQEEMKSESASAIQKENDTAHATAKFVFIV